MNKIILSERMLFRKCILHSSQAVTHHHTVQNHLNIHQQRRNFTPGIWESISASKPVGFLQDLTIQLHDVSGMPWWSTIIVSTFMLRGFITLPLALYQNKNLAKFEKISTEDMPQIVKELKMETAVAVRKFNWTEQQARIMYTRSLDKQWKNLIAKENCHPMKSAVVLLFQLPLWIMQSCALRNMIFMQPDPSIIKAQIVCAEMTLGGFGWIPNLTEVDHSYILPVTLGLINLAILEVIYCLIFFYSFKLLFLISQIQIMSRKIERNTKLQKYGTYFFRTISVIMVPIAAFVPSGLSLYWVSSSTFGLLQNLLILSPKVRRMARIPKVNSEFERPYKHLYDKIRERIGK